MSGFRRGNLIRRACQLSLIAGCGVLAVLASGCGEEIVDPPPIGTPNQSPTAAFAVDVTAGTAPLEVTFDASASSDPDGSVESYSWTFGDGTNGTGVSATHTYQVPGQFTPVLTVADDRGSTGIANGDRISVNSPAGNGANEISGVVWHDGDADGQQDAGEEIVPELAV